MKRLAKLAFAAIALALLIRFVSPEALLAALRQADGRWVTAGMALLYTSQLLGSLNFHQILVARGARLGRMDVVRADLAGQFYALGLPGGLVVGAGIRLVHLARQGNMGKLLAGLLSSRLLETLTYAVTTALLLPVVAQRLGAPWPLWAAIGATVLVAGTGYAASWSRPLGIRFRLLLRRLPSAGMLGRRLGATRWQNSSLPLSRHLSILALAGLRHLVGGAGLTAIIYGLGAGLIPEAAFWTRSMTGIAMLLPVSIGGLGVRESIFIVMLAPFGVPAPAAMAASLVVFGGLLGLALLGAVSELDSSLRTPAARRAAAIDKS
jgi:glycosyltransferase 2 family protein